MANEISSSTAVNPFFAVIIPLPKTNPKLLSVTAAINMPEIVHIDLLKNNK
jgi:hypothetical protein